MHQVTREKVIFLTCHKEQNGTVGGIPYSQITAELERIMQDHGIDNARVYPQMPAKIWTESNPRRMPDGRVEWQDKEGPAPWKPTDNLFSLDFVYDWGEALFAEICRYFTSIPKMDGRWDVEIVDAYLDAKWRISANEETYEFLFEQWEIIPESNPVLLTACTAEEVKAMLLDAYDWAQRLQNTERKPYKPLQEKWLYIEDGNVIQHFYKRSDLAQYIYTSETPKDGFVKLVFEDDHRKTERTTGVQDTAEQFLARYEQFHPLFPPRDKEVPKRLQKTRYVMDGEECTAKDMWERHYRSQIDSLMSAGPENHIAALVLMLPCMEMVYKLKTGRRKQDWTEIMKMFFPASGFSDKLYSQLRDLVRNGFVHEGFTKGYVGISSAHHTPEAYSETGQVFVGMSSAAGQFNLLIIPTLFWARVRNRIDSFYKYEQWIPGGKMQQLIIVNP